MSSLIPNRFLFDFEFPLHYRSRSSKLTGSASDWSDEDLLPAMGELDGSHDYARVWACWNEQGLFFACNVSKKKTPLECRLGEYWKGDNVRICTDMRDARSIKRASRTCQTFFLLPTGTGPDGKAPAIGTAKIKRAREDAPAIDKSKLRIASKIGKTGYSLEAHIPAECLSGFDPTEHPRIGFYYIIEDQDHGQQFLTVGDELAWHVDPSTWATAVLTK